MNRQLKNTLLSPLFILGACCLFAMVFFATFPIPTDESRFAPNACSFGKTAHFMKLKTGSNVDTDLASANTGNLPEVILMTYVCGKEIHLPRFDCRTFAAAHKTSFKEIKRFLLKHTDFTGVSGDTFLPEKTPVCYIESNDYPATILLLKPNPNAQ